MNKTLTINLGGRIFHVDESAYQLLYDYLYNLRHAFEKQEDGEEIVNDLENRLAELLQENLNDKQEVVTTAIVENSIKKLGKPEEISGEQPEPDTEEKKTEEKKEEDTPTDKDQPKEESKTESAQTDTGTDNQTASKRLFRDPDNRILGGVAGGLALYFNWDPTLIRLLLVVLLFVGYGTLVPIYLVCWLVIPQAKTAADKLNMRGRPVTMENIGKVVTDSFDQANDYLRSDETRTGMQRFADGMVKVIGFLIKVMVVIIVICCAPIIVIVLLAVCALLLGVIAELFGGWSVAFLPDWLSTVATHAPAIALWCYATAFVGSILLLSCLVSYLCKTAFHTKGFTPPMMKVLLSIGIVALVAAVVLGFVGGWHFPPFEYQPVIEYDYL